MQYNRLSESVLLLERTRLMEALRIIPEDTQSEEAQACQLRYQLVELNREITRRFAKPQVA